MKTADLSPRVQDERHSDRKHQKKKKKKKRAERRRSSTSSSSSDGNQWVEKPSCTAAVAAPKPSTTDSGDALSSTAAAEPTGPQRDAWREVEDIFAGVTAGEVRNRRRQTKQQAREAEERQRRADYEARKWREPDERSAKSTVPVGDGGASWLRRALQRAEQQAAESGKPLEVIVSDRWGSMERLQSMLDAAERKTIPSRQAPDTESNARERGWRRDCDRHRSESRKRRRSRSREGKRDRSRELGRSMGTERGRSRSEERRQNRSQEQRRSISEERGRRRSKEPRPRSRERRSKGEKLKWNKSKDVRENAYIDTRSSSSSNERKLDRSRSRERRQDRGKEKRRSKCYESERKRSEEGRSGGADKKNDADDSVKSYSRKKRGNSEDGGDESPSRVATRDGKAQKGWHKPSSFSEVSPSHRCADTDAGKHSLYTEHPPSNPSSVSAGEDDDQKSRPTKSVRPLTDSEMNTLAAKILKAELNGDDDDVAELQKQLDAARQLRAVRGSGRTVDSAEKVVVVVDKNERGSTAGDSRPSKRRKADTHRSGERMKYFADDDRLSLRDMFERERRTTPADEAAALARLTARGVRQNRHRDDEHSLDDQLTERAGRAEPERVQDERAAARARTQHRHLERCTRCFDSRHTLRHLIAALGDKCYLSLPADRSVTQHHCLIVPLQHAVSLISIGEDAWEELTRFRAAIVAMFTAEGKDVIFFENALKLPTHPHAVLHCVPVPRDTGELAPIYFKKALEESETEWSQNKKVLDLRGRDVRRVVPRGLPYFFVDFNLQPGFAHVVEDEDLFPDNFAQEVIGGMLELDPSAWRRSKNETTEQQRKKAMDFANIWEPHDFTREG